MKTRADRNQPPPRTAVDLVRNRLTLGVQPKLAVSTPADPFEPRFGHSFGNVRVHTPALQAPPSVQRQPADGKPEDPILKLLTPDDDERYLTADELKIVMSSEEARRKILTAAIDRLFVLVDLLRANDARLRPMSAETAGALMLVRRYLRVVPTGFFGGANLEFDWLNEPANELFLKQTMRALELMILARGRLLPKFHFKPPQCENQPGLYALTLLKIDLCPNFFGKGPDKDPVCPDWVLLHEYFHPLGLTHGEISSSDPRMNVPGPKQAIQNANALASLAFELAGRDLKKCRAPEAAAIHKRADEKYVNQR